MSNSFALVVVITLTFCATPIFGLTAINYHNDYAIFRPAGNGLRFDLRKRVEILFLDRPDEEPTFEKSLFALKIEHKRNHTTKSELVDVILYKNGVVVDEATDILDNLSCLRNIQLGWETSGVPSFRISVKKSVSRSNVLNWDDLEGSSAVNITHLAVKANHSITIHLRDSFLWLSNVYSACPYHEAELSCALNIPRHRSTLVDDHANSSVSRVVRKVMEMRLLAKNPKSPNYEMFIVANQTDEKIDPRLHIVRDGVSQVKATSTAGTMNLGVNLTSGHLMLSKNNISEPFFEWTDETVAASFAKQGFRYIRFISVEVPESTASRSHRYGNDKYVANDCNLTCIEPKEVELPWYTRWKNKFTSALSRDTPVALPPRSDEDES